MQTSSGDLTKDERRLLYDSLAGDFNTLGRLLDYIDDEMTVLGLRDRRIGQVKNRLHGMKYRLHAGYVKEFRTSLSSPFFRLRKQETN